MCVSVQFREMKGLSAAVETKQQVVRAYESRGKGEELARATATLEDLQKRRDRADQVSHL